MLSAQFHPTSGAMSFTGSNAKITKWLGRTLQCLAILWTKPIKTKGYYLQNRALLEFTIVLSRDISPTISAATPGWLDL